MSDRFSLHCSCSLSLGGSFLSDEDAEVDDLILFLMLLLLLLLPTMKLLSTATRFG